MSGYLTRWRDAPDTPEGRILRAIARWHYYQIHDELERVVREECDKLGAMERAVALRRDEPHPDTARLADLFEKLEAARAYLYKCRAGTVTASIELRRHARRLESGNNAWGKILDLLANSIAAFERATGHPDSCNAKGEPISSLDAARARAAQEEPK